MKNKLYLEMYREYKKGYSLSQVGRMFGMTRQSVYEGFHIRGFVLRKIKPVPYQIFNGIKFSRRANGYYAETSGDRQFMHVRVWEHFNGIIPNTHSIHHIDKDVSNNKIGNLKMIGRGEHTALHAAERKRKKGL